MKKLFGAILAFSLVFPTMNVYATDGDDVTPPSSPAPVTTPADGPKEPAPGPKTPGEPAGEDAADKQGETPEGGAEAAKPAEKAESEAAPAEGETPAAKDEKKEEAAPAVDESSAVEKKEEPAAPAGEKENAEAPAGEKAEVEEDKKADKEEVSDKKEAEDKEEKKDSKKQFTKVTQPINKKSPTFVIKQADYSTSIVTLADDEGTILEGYEVVGSVRVGFKSLDNFPTDPYIGKTYRLTVNDDVFKYVITPLDFDHYRISLFSVSNDGTDFKNDKDTLVSSYVGYISTIKSTPVPIECPSLLVDYVKQSINNAIAYNNIQFYRDKQEILKLNEKLATAKTIKHSIRKEKVDISTLNSTVHPFVADIPSKVKGQYQIFDINHFIEIDDNERFYISEPSGIGLDQAFVSIPLSELDFPEVKDGYKRQYNVWHDNHFGSIHPLQANVSDGNLIFGTSNFSHFIVEITDAPKAKASTPNAASTTVAAKNNSASTGVHVQPHPAPEGAVWNPLTGLFDAKPGYKWDDSKQTFVRDGSVSRIPSTGDEGLNLYIAMLVAGMVAVASASYKLVQSKH